MVQVVQRRPVRQAADQMIAPKNGNSPSPRPTAYVLHLRCNCCAKEHLAFPSAVRHSLVIPTGRCYIVEIGKSVESEAQKQKYKQLKCARR